MGMAKYEILRKDQKDSTKFDIMSGTTAMGSIAKRCEKNQSKDQANPSDSSYESRYIRINFPHDLRLYDKMLCLATAFIIVSIIIVLCHLGNITNCFFYHLMSQQNVYHFKK